MKKLLSLLSALTISGTAVPTTIAASPYQKEKTIKNSEINYQQTNNLEKLNRNKRQNNNQNIIGISEVVINAGGKIYSSGVVLNDKVYFGSWDNKVYEYDPSTNQKKVVITTENSVYSSGVVLNDKVYFGSQDSKVYEYDPSTNQQKVVIDSDAAFFGSGVVLNDKLYVGSWDKKVYEYDPVTNQQKVVITTNREVSSSGAVLNDKVYFGSLDNKVYEYDPLTEKTKIIFNTDGEINSSGVVLNNKLYVGSWDKKVYEYDPVTNQQKVVITTGGRVSSSGVVLNDKLYFGSWDKKVYEYDPVTNKQKVVIITDGDIYSSGVVLNDKLYFGSWDKKVYEYDPVTNKQKVVIITDGDIYSSGVVLNDKLYVGSLDNKVYEYDPLELIESNIINMREQIKRGLYLYYKKQNPNSEIKTIYNINLNKLISSPDVIIEANQKSKSSNLEKNLSVCKDYGGIFVNNTSIQQTLSTISCSKELKEINTFQKMNGFSKSDSSSENNNWSTNINTKVTAKASGEAGIPIVANGKVEVDVEVGGGYTWGESQNYTITDTSNSSDTEIKTIEDYTKVTFPSQNIALPPHSKISIYAKSWENNITLILSCYQKVEGLVSTSFIDLSNNEHKISISIKDAILSLQENNILPSKIKINDDSSINFSYDIKSIEQIIMQDIEINEISNLSSYEKNVKFKDNTTGVVIVKN